MSYADLVLRDGAIITMDTSQRVVESLAVKDGVFTAVGSKPEVKRLIGPMTEVVELGGRAVTPGLINSHDHMLEHGISSRYVADIRYPQVKSIKDMLTIIGEQVEKTEPGRWVKAQNWDEALLEEHRYPTRYDLDRVSPNNPVWARRVFQMCTVNSLALEIAGITKDTVDPDQGWIQRDEEGEPTGVLRGKAMYLISRVIPELTQGEIDEAIIRGCKEFNEAGFTTVIEPGLMENWINAYRRVYRENRLKIRTFIQVGFLQNLEDVQWAIDNYDVGGTDGLRIIGLKMAVDGGVGPRTALFYEPYLDGEPTHLGVQQIQEEELKKMVTMGHRTGFQVAIHAIGDKGIDITLDAYEEAIYNHPRPDPRHQIVHAFFPTMEANQRITDLGLMVNTQTPFLYLLGDSFIQARGPETVKCMPIKTWQSNGIPVGTSHDATVSLPLPHLGLYGAVARETIQGQSMGMEEKVSTIDALKMYTTDAAKHCFMEDKLGSIEVGKLADLAVWNFNPLEVEPVRLLDWRCEMTYLQGERIS